MEAPRRSPPKRTPRLKRQPTTSGKNRPRILRGEHDGEVEASAEEEGFAESSVDAETEESEDESPRDAPQAPAPKVERPPELTTEERLAELVEGFATEGQTILYYRTMLERNDWLDEAYEDETAPPRASDALSGALILRDVLRASSSRRKGARGGEDSAPLILGWGSIDRTNLDKLKRQFCAPSTLIERTLKEIPRRLCGEGEISLQPDRRRARVCGEA